LDCGAATCDSGGFCSAARVCNASTPCALGQQCTAGTCTDARTPVQQRLTTQTLRGSTIIVGNGNSVVTHDNFSQRIRQALGAGNTYVRFVNLAPDAGSLSLNANGVAIPGGVFSPNLDLDPA